MLSRRGLYDVEQSTKHVTVGHRFETGTNTAKTTDDDKGSIDCHSEDKQAWTSICYKETPSFLFFVTNTTWNLAKVTLMLSPVTLCNLGVGATFGESILHDLPRDSTVVTKTTCELLRVEQQDFRLIWELKKTDKS
uniref:Cyclic nucleotide-binding domain-containing protein n=1 Tax=Glossina pallidipes TaxID=7398 RepID=A0A1A9Z827_GLOPL